MINIRKRGFMNISEKFEIECKICNVIFTSDNRIIICKKCIKDKLLENIKLLNGVN